MNEEQLAAHRGNFERAYAASNHEWSKEYLSSYWSHECKSYPWPEVNNAFHGYLLAITDMEKQAVPVAQLSEPPARIHVTEEMHRAAVQVIYRANGNAGIGQRLMDAMLAAAPTTTKDAS